MVTSAPTSERLSVEHYQSTATDYFIYLAHVATYEFARQYVTGRTVLDFGCGTGYGTLGIARDAASTVGVDISPEAIATARGTFLPAAAGADLDYRVIPPVEGAPLPFPDGHFDTVLSFQVIEHVPSVECYLDEVRRVLRPGGAFICATPDRRTRLFPGQRPFNRFHLDEWNPSQFLTLLDSAFMTTTVYGMTATPRALDVELRRCRRTRLLTYPFTFPGAPEGWRQAGLRRMQELQRGRRNAQPDPSVDAGGGPEAAFGFGLDDIVIGPDAWPSVNIVTVSF